MEGMQAWASEMAGADLWADAYVTNAVHPLRLVQAVSQVADWALRNCYELHVCIWEMVSAVGCGCLIAELLAGMVTSEWRETLSRRRFMLTNPAPNVPDLEAVFDGRHRRSDRGFTASILLAASPALLVRLDLELRSKLREVATRDAAS